MEGEALLAALGATRQDIKLFTDGEFCGRITPEQAMSIAKACQGGDQGCIGAGNPTRVRKLFMKASAHMVKSVRPAPTLLDRLRSEPDMRTFQRDASFWDGRSVFRFWGDQANHGRVVALDGLEA